MSRLVIPEQAARQICSQLLASPLESAGMLLAEAADTGSDEDRLIYREFLPAPEDAYIHRTGDRIELKPEFLAWAFKRARLNSWSVFLTHTHPWSGSVAPSAIDLVGERALRPTLFNRIPGRKHGRLIVGHNDYEAALWSDDRDEGRPLRVFAVGNDYREFVEAGTSPNPAEVIFDRQVRMLGIAGQRKLQNLRVGIVGLGGTGSIVAQQLAHLGVADFLLIDPDTIEESNLNRVVGATRRDLGKPKTAVSARLISSIRPNARIHQAQRSIIVNRTAKLLLGTDMFFCCTDSHGSRAVLNQLAYQYLLPGIDIGVQVSVDKGRITSVSGRVQMMSPPSACLLCGSLLDSDLVRQDLMTDFQRQADPYIVGAHEPQPAVISLNSVVSSLAVTMCLSAVVGFPLESRYQIYRADLGVVRAVLNSPVEDCIVCSSTGALGRGDKWDLPGRNE